jgi:hypothetical protein
MVIGPGILKTVRQLFHRLNAPAIPNQEANDRRRHTAHQENQILHARPFISHFYYLFVRRQCLDAREGNGVTLGWRRAWDGRLEHMDRVRFGRALGYGARHAARSLMKAAEAASASNPAAASKPSASASQARSAPAVGVSERVVQTRRTVVATKTHAKALGRSVWSPLAKFSSVVWLQVTGVFFTLLALFLSQGLWRERNAVRMPMGSHQAISFYVHAIAFAVFTYFAVSNFVRAYLRDRK